MAGGRKSWLLRTKTWPVELILFTSALISGVGGYAQSRNPVEIELGVNSSGLPRRSDLAGGVEKTLPLVSPVFGLWINSPPDRKFGLSVGVQYYRTGQRYQFVSERYDQLNQATVSMSTREDMTFRQVCVPILATYSFPVGVFKMGLVVGVRVSNFTSGSYYFRQEITYDPDIGRDYFNEKGFDPFSDDLQTPANRIYPQGCLGLWFSWSSRWRTSLIFSQGPSVTYIEHKPAGSIWDDPSYKHSYSRGDFSLSMRYRVF
jgi:hypothetical protein